MNSQEYRNLQEAYRAVELNASYEPMTPARNRRVERQIDKAAGKETRAVKSRNEPEVNKQMQRRIAMQSPQSRRNSLQNKNINASYEPDLFDVILKHLIAEGYADTNENALVIMANMSEEWRENILTEVSQKEFDDGMRKAAAKMPSDVHTPSREELFGSKKERSKAKPSKGVVNPTPPTSANIRKSSEYSSPRASRGLPAAGYN